MKAMDVLRAARATFGLYGDVKYAASKADSFIRRCGVKIEDGLDQDIPKNIIDQVVYAMLDSDSEQVFYSNLTKVL